MPEIPSGMPNQEDEITPLGVPDDVEDDRDEADGDELPGFPEGDPHIDG